MNPTTAVAIELAKIFFPTTIALAAVLIARGQKQIAARQADTSSRLREIAESQASLAARQAEYARLKLNHDLFDRRYVIFLAAKKLFEQMTIEVRRDDLREFRQEILPAQYLFPDEVVAFLHDAVEQGMEMRRNTRQLDRAITSKDQESVNRESEREYALMTKVDEMEKAVAAKFKPYLNLASVQ